jgi:heme exporter protein D
MNTLQWFGKNIFVDGNVLGFFVASAFALSIVVLVLGTVYKLITGQKL